MNRRIELSPMLLLGAAATMLGLARHGAPDSELMLREVGQPAGRLWDTAFVHHAGYWAHYDHTAERSMWPLPATNDCNVWARFAERRGVLVDAQPRGGDVFLKWSPKRRRFVHAGIVAAYADATGILANGMCYLDCDTIEGNISAAGHYPSEGIHRQRRRFVTAKGDRFIRWSELDEPAEPLVCATPAEVCRGLMLRARAA